MWLPSGVGRRMDAVELPRATPGRAALSRFLEQSGFDELGDMLARRRVVYPDVVGEGGNGHWSIRVEHERVDAKPGGIPQRVCLLADVVPLLRVRACRAACRLHAITLSGHRSADADAIGESLTCHIIIYIIHSK